MTTDGRDGARAPLVAVVAIAAAIVALPIASTLGFGEIGGFRMFTRPREVHLSIATVDRSRRTRPLRAERIAPHLTSDGRRQILAAMRGWLGVEVASRSFEDAAPALASLACAIEPSAIRARVALSRRDPIAGRIEPPAITDVACVR